MAKGSSFERHIAKDLSLWWTNNKRDDVFWRTAGSGARATTRNKNKVCTINSAGDLCYLDPIGKPFLDYFLVEIKRGYKDFSVMDLIDRKKKNCLIEKWIKKAEKEKEQEERVSILLIVKRDYKKTIVICRDINLIITSSECLKFKLDGVNYLLTTYENFKKEKQFLKSLKKKK